ncbi:unnamed protein product [Phyllotreta striolata]|uniref:Chromo domain-containing protein n=1 Tax=Phyllotreta striolata TaxID=444603 RepID=A0A9N9TJN9_PHYSR|nr:unnamed protein product [Phyllotreta striolata]
MKRKTSRKSQQPEDNGVGSEDNEHNLEEQEPLSQDDEDKPLEKRRKSSKSSKKSQKKQSKNGDTESKKPEKKPENSDGEENASNAEEEESQYEVEKILGEKVIKGVRHFLIRWKGYEEESDTWEPVDTLSCNDLIKAYRAKKKSSPKTNKKPSKPKDTSDEWDENEDFEVDKILDVHFCKDGKREFLVSWKGYSMKESSWEPEENMSCKELIAKFMQKVEHAKSLTEKELRVNRKHVQRLTYNSPEGGRRLSKRMSGKERVQYHDTD